MGVTLSAAGSYKWFCENFSGGDYKGTDAMAESSPCGAGGVIFLPYLNGERCPVNDPNARGCFVGLSAGTGKGDLARAVLEGVAFSLKQTYDRVSPEGTAERVILAGGGSKSPLWRQIFADVFGLPVVTLDGAGEGSGFGAGSRRRDRLRSVLLGFRSGGKADNKDRNPPDTGKRRRLPRDL